MSKTNKTKQARQGVRPSVSPYEAEMEGFEELVDQCDLHLLPPTQSRLFRNILYDLYFAEQVTVEGITYPRMEVRSRLETASLAVLERALAKAKASLGTRAAKSVKYLRSCVFNELSEQVSDLELDPLLNALEWEDWP